MRRSARLITALFVLLSAAPAVAAQTTEERARLDWVERRGRLLFELDRAAWVGTDDMLERMPDAGSLGMRGSIVERDGEALSVIFFGGPQESPVAFYRGRVVDHHVVEREIFPAAARPPLDPAQRRLAAVRAMASRTGSRSCNEGPLNTAIVPPESPDGPIDLYLLTPQLRAGEIPFGGHYRFTIAADGSTVSSREFTRSCFAFPAAPNERGERPVGMVVTHLLDQIPTEIHVFNSMSAGMPVAVGTTDPQRVWLVEGDRISLIDPER